MPASATASSLSALSPDMPNAPGTAPFGSGIGRSLGTGTGIPPAARIIAVIKCGRNDSLRPFEGERQHGADLPLVRTIRHLTLGVSLFRRPGHPGVPGVADRDGYSGAPVSIVRPPCGALTEASEIRQARLPRAARNSR